MVGLEVEQTRRDAALDERLDDLAGHRLGGVPHRVVHHDRVVLGLKRAPARVGLEDLGHVAAPDDAVARRDHVDVEPAERVEGAHDVARVGHHDVGVVLLGLREHLGQSHLVVEALRGGEMLAERVVGEQDAVLGAVGDHVVGPVHHDRLGELQRATADAQAVAGFDRHVAQVAVMGGQALHAVRGAAVDLGVGRQRVDGRQRAGMVLLHMVGDDVLDLGRVDDLANALDQLVGKAGLARVDERGVLIHDEVGVVRRTPVGGVPVEITLVPIDAAHPVDARLHLDRMQHGRLLLRFRAPVPGKARLPSAQEYSEKRRRPSERHPSGTISPCRFARAAI